MRTKRKKKFIHVEVKANAPYDTKHMVFNPDPAYVFEPQEIRFTFKRGSDRGLKFVGFWSDASPEFGKPSFHHCRREMIIRDLDEVKSNNPIYYKVSFKDRNGVIHEPDPQIINNPTMTPRPRPAQ